MRFDDANEAGTETAASNEGNFSLPGSVVGAGNGFLTKSTKAVAIGVVVTSASSFS